MPVFGGTAIFSGDLPVVSRAQGDLLDRLRPGEQQPCLLHPVDLAEALTTARLSGGTCRISPTPSQARAAASRRRPDAETRRTASAWAKRPASVARSGPRLPRLGEAVHRGVPDGDGGGAGGCRGCGGGAGRAFHQRAERCRVGAQDEAGLRARPLTSSYRASAARCRAAGRGRRPPRGCRAPARRPLALISAASCSACAPDHAGVARRHRSGWRAAMRSPSAVRWAATVSRSARMRATVAARVSAGRLKRSTPVCTIRMP